MYQSHRALLTTYLRPHRRHVWILFGLLALSIGLQLLNPQLIRYVLDAAQPGVPERALVSAAIIFIVVGLVQRGMALLALYTSENVGWRATNSLRHDAVRHVLELDLGFHKQHTPGDLIERIDGDTTLLANFFGQLVVRVLGNALLVIGILVLLALEDWRVGLALTVYTLVVLGGLQRVQHIAVQHWAAEREASTDQYSFLEEWMSGSEDVRANGAEAYVLRRLDGLTHRSLIANRSAQLASNISFIVTNGMLTLAYALGLGLSVWLYSRGASIGTAYLVVFYIGMLYGPLEEIRDQVQDLQRASAAIARVDQLLGIRSTLHDAGTRDLPAGPLSVRFDAVDFGYAADQPVLHAISFELQAGRTLALLGRTGSGKTTLTRLLFRLYDPDAGQIELAGSDLRDLDSASLREHVGLVTQDVQLFAASVRDNLTLFNSSINDAALWTALDELGLAAWVRTLPSGLDTQLVGSGSLSAGEAQLLAFARVLLKNPSLVILDEASSRLDPATERLLEQAIERLLHGRTGIIIAHRLSTLARVDDVLVLDDGHVLEHGPRAILAADPASRFAHLLRTGIEEVLA